MTARWTLLGLSVWLLHCHAIIDFQELQPGETSTSASGAPGAGQAGQQAAGQGGQAGAGASGQAGSAGEGGAGPAGSSGAGEAGASGVGEGGSGEGGSGTGGAGQTGGGQAGSSSGPEAGKPCEGSEAVCVGDDLFRCQASVWTKQACGLGCLPEQADCLRFTDIAAGNPFTCVRRTDGTVWCWGGNGLELSLQYPLGILGQPIDQLGVSDTPVKIEGLSGVKRLVSGMFHACALLETEQVVCWGNNGQHRTLGSSKSVVYSWEPVPVPGLPGGIQELFAGETSTCARDSQGDVYCWGERLTGKGDSWFDGATLQPQFKEASALVLSMYHGCGLFPGETRCWGANWIGQLALGSADEDAHPDPLQAQVPPLPWLGLGAGEHNTFLWTKNEFYGWGGNEQGQLGLSGTGVFAPTNLKPFWKYVKAQTFQVKQVAQGFRFTCALIEEDGVRHVRCAGLNDAFQCGGEGNFQVDPRDISDGKTILQAESMAIGWRHGCAIEVGGEHIKCWGIAHGNGTDADTPTPTEVAWPP